MNEAYQYTTSSIEQSIIDTIASKVSDLKLEPQHHIKQKLLSPWEIKVSGSYDPDQVKRHRSRISRGREFPVFIVDNGKDFTAFGEDAKDKVTASRISQVAYPCVTVSEEMYTRLSERGVTPQHIAAYALSELKDHPLPKSESLSKQESVKQLLGVTYCNQFVPSKRIAACREPLRWMRKIFESEELKKAFSELYNEEME
jgi:hypothetical protein